MDKRPRPEACARRCPPHTRPLPLSFRRAAVAVVVCVRPCACVPWAGSALSSILPCPPPPVRSGFVRPRQVVLHSPPLRSLFSPPCLAVRFFECVRAALCVCFPHPMSIPRIPPLLGALAWARHPPFLPCLARVHFFFPSPKNPLPILRARARAWFMCSFYTREKDAGRERAHAASASFFGRAPESPLRRDVGKKRESGRPRARAPAVPPSLHPHPTPPPFSPPEFESAVEREL